MNPPELNLPSPAGEPIRGLFSRRSLIQGAAVGASALALAACSSKTGGRPEAATDISDTQKSLRFDGRETYRNSVGEDFPLLSRFSDASGISVTFTNQVADDNTYYQKVKPQLQKGEDIGSDASVLSDWMAAKWIRLGYAQEIRRENITNFDNLRLLFRGADSSALRKASMPWRSGFTGVAWNTELVPNGISAVSDLWTENLHGRVGAMSSMRDTVGLIMLDRGIDISSSDWGDKEFTETIDFLRPLVTDGQLRSIKGDKYKDDLIKGSTVAAIARAGDIMQLNKEVGREKWAFAIPANGGVVWSDVVVVPIGSTHRTNVEKFINFYYDRQNAVEVAADTGFISPVENRTPEIGTIPSEISRNTMIFPTEAVLNTTKMFRQLSEAEEQRFMAQFQTILLAASS